MKTNFIATSILFLITIVSSVTMANNTSNKSPIDMSNITVGVQLWSVRDELEKDFKGTLKALANMGFTSIEAFGGFGTKGEFKGKPQALKAYLDSLGLSVIGAHASFEELSDKNREQTLHHYKILGANYLIIPWDERAWHRTKIKDFVNDLNHLHPIITKAGFKFGFHNHDQEFNSYKGQTYWDYIAQNTNPKMVLQLDIGWVNYKSKDPHHFVKTYPKRTLTTHFKVRTHPATNKESRQSPILGKDGYDWVKLLKTMQKSGGTKWVILEQEEYPNGMSSLEAVAATKLGFYGMIGG